MHARSVLAPPYRFGAGTRRRVATVPPPVLGLCHARTHTRQLFSPPELQSLLDLELVSAGTAPTRRAEGVHCQLPPSLPCV